MIQRNEIEAVFAEALSLIQNPGLRAKVIDAYMLAKSRRAAGSR